MEHDRGSARISHQSDAQSDNGLGRLSVATLGNLEDGRTQKGCISIFQPVKCEEQKDEGEERNHYVALLNEGGALGRNRYLKEDLDGAYVFEGVPKHKITVLTQISNIFQSKRRETSKQEGKSCWTANITQRVCGSIYPFGFAWRNDMIPQHLHHFLEWLCGASSGLYAQARTAAKSGAISL